MHTGRLLHLLGAAVALCALFFVGACSKSFSGSVSCPFGKTPCGSLCVDLTENPLHCGECGLSCGDGVCNGGRCESECPQPTLACNGACVDTSSSDLHCGGCNRLCEAPSTCISGTCGCPDGLAFCGGSCVIVAEDPDNCGGCGIVCSESQVCSNGECAGACVATKSACERRCVDTAQDERNCGGCGEFCEEGLECLQGGCRCPVGTTLCDGSCVNVHESTAHCGACGESCESGEVCLNGSCRGNCAEGQVRCGTTCVTLGTDAHCNGCNQACTGGRICSNRRCTCKSEPSNPGEVVPIQLCNDSATGSQSCVDVRTNSSYCGSCVNACDPGEGCFDAQCTSTCPEGTRLCVGQCVNTATDSRNCGDCGEGCAGGTTCQDGQCRCSGSQELCDGACTDTDSSLDHCGRCNQRCTAGQRCQGGMCRSPDIGPGPTPDPTSPPEIGFFSRCDESGVICPSVLEVDCITTGFEDDRPVARCTRSCGEDRNCADLGSGACCRNGICVPSEMCSTGGDDCNDSEAFLTPEGASCRRDCECMSGTICVNHGDGIRLCTPECPFETCESSRWDCCIVSEDHDALVCSCLATDG